MGCYIGLEWDLFQVICLAYFFWWSSSLDVRVRSCNVHLKPVGSMGSICHKGFMPELLGNFYPKGLGGQFKQILSYTCSNPWLVFFWWSWSLDVRVRSCSVRLKPVGSIGGICHNGSMLELLGNFYPKGLGGQFKQFLS